MNVIILLITTMYDEVYMYLADEHKIKVLTNTIICNSDFMILRHKGIIHYSNVTHHILPLSFNREVVCFQLTKL